MKFTLNKGANAEAVVLRLITVVLGAYALALFAQTTGVAHFA
ncbi:MAG: hypothetical protein WA138_15810 [Parvibaculum sp.]